VGPNDWVTNILRPLSCLYIGHQSTSIATPYTRRMETLMTLLWKSKNSH